MNINRIREIANGSEEFIQLLLMKFPPLLQQSIDELKSAIPKKNNEELISIIHKLKPNLELIEAYEAHNLSIELIEKLKNNDGIELFFFEILNQFIYSLEQTIEETNELIKT